MVASVHLLRWFGVTFLQSDMDNVPPRTNTNNNYNNISFRCFFFLLIFLLLNLFLFVLLPLTIKIYFPLLKESRAPSVLPFLHLHQFNHFNFSIIHFLWRQFYNHLFWSLLNWIFLIKYVLNVIRCRKGFPLIEVQDLRTLKYSSLRMSKWLLLCIIDISRDNERRWGSLKLLLNWD